MTGRAGAKDTRMMGDSSTHGGGCVVGKGMPSARIWIPLLGNPTSVLSSVPQRKQGLYSALLQARTLGRAQLSSGTGTEHITKLLPAAALEVFIPFITLTCWV